MANSQLKRQSNGVNVICTAPSINGTMTHGRDIIFSPRIYPWRLTVMVMSAIIRIRCRLFLLVNQVNMFVGANPFNYYRLRFSLVINRRRFMMT